MRRDLKNLAEVVVKQLNRKIDGMERCFRRKLRNRNSRRNSSKKRLSNHIRSISIDLSNKENIDPNIPDLRKRIKRVKKGQIQCSINNKIVDIDVKKNDNPYDLARRVLLQKGLGLGYMERLAQNIDNFQQKIFS